MTQKWVDEQGDYAIGEAGFLISFDNENTGGERYMLRDTPAHTNMSRMPRLIGWCGSYNNIGTHAEGVWRVVRIAKNGRTLIEEVDGDARQAFLDEMGYPNLDEDD